MTAVSREDLPGYSGADGRCKKCGARGPHTDWVAPSVGVYTPETMETVENRGPYGDLMKRECRSCSYVWFELPADDPAAIQPDDPRDGEISALRALLADIWNSCDEDFLESSLNSTTLRALRIVAEDWNASNVRQAEEPPTEEQISAVAPYFAPLRPENR